MASSVEATQITLRIGPKTSSRGQDLKNTARDARHMGQFRDAKVGRAVRGVYSAGTMTELLAARAGAIF